MFMLSTQPPFLQTYACYKSLAHRPEQGVSGRERGRNLLAVIFPRILAWRVLLVLIRRLPLQKRIVP